MGSASEYQHEFTVAIVASGDDTVETTETNKEAAPAAVSEEKPTETVVAEKKEETATDATKTDEAAADSMTDGKTEESATTKPSTEDAATTTTTETTTATTTTTDSKKEEAKPAAGPVPVCTVTFRATYKPSAKDKQEELYDMLNKASQKKSEALGRLRRSVAVKSRVAPSTAPGMSAGGGGKAVQKGFLNGPGGKTPAKKPSKVMQWYDRNFGPQSFVRRWFPLVKNYLIFFGAIGVMHFQGHELALPAPV